jgi:hypothetical protein
LLTSQVDRSMTLAIRGQFPPARIVGVNRALPDASAVP